MKGEKRQRVYIYECLKKLRVRKRIPNYMLLFCSCDDVEVVAVPGRIVGGSIFRHATRLHVVTLELKRVIHGPTPAALIALSLALTIEVSSPDAVFVVLGWLGKNLWQATALE